MAQTKVTPNELSPDTVSAVLGSTFTSSSTSSFQDTGLSVTLANPGTWVLIADLRATVGAQDRFLTSRFYNVTAATGYANSERLGGYFSGNTASSLQCTIVMTEIITTTTANNVIRVEIKPGGTYTTQLSSDTNGKSAFRAFRIG